MEKIFDMPILLVVLAFCWLMALASQIFFFPINFARFVIFAVKNGVFFAILLLQGLWKALRFLCIYILTPIARFIYRLGLQSATTAFYIISTIFTIIFRMALGCIKFAWLQIHCLLQILGHLLKAYALYLLSAAANKWRSRSSKKDAALPPPPIAAAQPPPPPPPPAENFVLVTCSGSTRDRPCKNKKMVPDRNPIWYCRFHGRTNG